MDPAQRLTARQALAHPFLAGCGGASLPRACAPVIDGNASSGAGSDAELLSPTSVTQPPAAAAAAKKRSSASDRITRSKRAKAAAVGEFDDAL